MSINHSGLKVFVAQQFLHRTYVVAVHQQMGGKGMAEGVAAYFFDDARLINCLLDGPV